MTTLYTLHIITRHESGVTAYVRHGVTGASYNGSQVRVEYDDTSPIAAITFDVIGTIVTFTLTEEV